MQKILQSTDYSKFRSVRGNRTLNRLHLSRLMESIKANPLFTAIAVNDKFEIVDGQHRFECFRQLKLPVNYYIVKGYGLEEVHALNQNAKVWNADDYLRGYCDMDLLDYKLYKNFKEKYGWTHTDTLSILCGGDDRKHDRAFKTGHLKVKDYKSACEKADRIAEIGQYYSNYRRRGFLIAMLQALRNPKFDFDVFMRKLKLQSSSLRDCANAAGYKEMIQNIYNYHNKHKLNLLF